MTTRPTRLAGDWLHCLVLAESKKIRVQELSREYRDAAEERVARQPERYRSVRRLTGTARERALNAIGDVMASSDPQIRLAIADNRWYIDQATMYGVGRLVEQQDIIIAQNEQIIDLLRALRGGQE